MKRWPRIPVPALLAVALAAAVPLSHVQAAGSPDVGGTGAAADQARWKIWGGEASFRWNRDLMSDLGIDVSAAIGGGKADAYGREQFSVADASALDLAIGDAGFAGFTGGSLLVRGGFDLRTADGRILLRDMRLVPRADDGFTLDVVTADGSAWFYIDRMMYEIEGEATPQLSIQTMDLRVAQALAQRLGRPEAEGLAVADLALQGRLHVDGAPASLLHAKGTASRWPGKAVPGTSPQQYYEADVLMNYFSVQYSRKSADASGPMGSGKVVFTPSSTLRNNRNDGEVRVTTPCSTAPCPAGAPAGMPADPLGSSEALYAADIAWHQKFTGNFLPYDNDQHPYLIWNLYRIVDGRIEQIGRSGVKHAFLTVNTACDANPGNGHILGRGCADTYGVGNNDSIGDLGPRSEIIPATGEWGRCGSVYDRDCNGIRDSGSPCSNLPGVTDCSSWSYRLQVDERDISPAQNPGASYWFESWYLVRDDINIYNTMQTRPATFNWSSGVWNVGNGPGSELKLGAAIDRWLPRGTATSTEHSADIESEHGQGRVAVKVVPLDGGGWRYDYVVANFDFAVAQVQYHDGQEGDPNKLQVLSNTGFTRFEVETAGPVPVSANGFSDGDRIDGNDWVFSSTDSRLAWALPGRQPAGSVDNALNWGTMFRFSIESDVAPVPGVAWLHAPMGTVIQVQTLVPDAGLPAEPPLFLDGFEALPLPERSAQPE